MSAIHERQWRLERERQIRQQQQKIREAEIQTLTNSYLQQYEQRLQNLEQQGLAQFVSQSVAHIRSEINRVRTMNAYDGRYRSFELRREIDTLYQHAFEARRIHEEHQRLLAEEAKRDAERLQAEKEQAWQDASRWENKLARNLAFKELATLKKQALSEGWDIAQIQETLTELQSQYEQKAQAISQQSKKEQEQQIIDEQKQILQKQIETANLPQSESERLKAQLNASDASTLSQIANEIHQAEDTAIEDEAIRKEMVKAVYQSLKQAGFTVLNPIKQGEGADSVVVVQASRPQGNQAKFRVKLDGSVRYEFDNYKGQRCKEDMAQVLPKLSEIYGVDLSDERVIWENPDDEHAEAKPITPLHTQKR